MKHIEHKCQGKYILTNKASHKYFSPMGKTQIEEYLALGMIIDYSIQHVVMNWKIEW